jgi:hypothetical protein
MVGSDDATVGRWVASLAQSCGNEAPESRQHFDVWSFGTAADDAGTSSYFGKMPPQTVEDLEWGCRIL